jgi:prevent-host-death family protein
MLTSRQFNQDRAGAKRAARKGPVIVTERGKPDLVLLSYDEYQRSQGKMPTLSDLLDCPAIYDVEDDVPLRSREIDRRDHNPSLLD